MIKVQIKKELAATIEEAKKKEYDLYFFFDQVYTTYGDYTEFSSYEPETIASAWINGYEIIETVEDKIMNRILELQSKIPNEKYITFIGDYVSEIKGLEFAYDLLMEQKNR